MSAVSLANEYVEDIYFDFLKKAMTRVQRIIQGDKSVCRCKSCSFEAVDEVNFWLWFLDVRVEDGGIVYYEVFYERGCFEIYVIVEKENK